MKKHLLFILLLVLFTPVIAFSSEIALQLPEKLDVLGISVKGETILWLGFIIIALGILFGLVQYIKLRKLPVHKSMLDISNIIWQTCRTYLIQQGKFLIILLLIIGVAIIYYLSALDYEALNAALAETGGKFSFGIVAPLVIFWTIIGILGSYIVAWFGMRINTIANSRTAFASLRARPLDVATIPLEAGMSVGLLLVCVELIMMLFILLLVPGYYAGVCFLGFAIGESLGASALRICGGIFTKIADIGSDLMKIVFKIKEDDPRNPGVIADCTGDNAGDSVGPTADGFETYGVTGVALISFIVLATAPEFQSTLIVWIFAMRVLMVFTSLFSYQINNLLSKAKYGKYGPTDNLNFETPLTNLVWITSCISIILTFLASFFLLRYLPDTTLWWKLSIIISCGTLASALIPELTKVFTSSKSAHVNEVVTATREGGASLTILSGLVTGNFSAFWQGLTMALLMFIAFYASTLGLDQIMEYPSIFAFGLVAFGFLGMGPVTIAVDSYGPVTDNAQSVFELSKIETLPNIKEEITQDYNFEPNFEVGKHNLEANDSAGNTFKATAKPILIGTAVIGATTMIFSIILILIKENLFRLQLTDPLVLLGFIGGGAVIFWFSGASIQAVTTGAYRAVEFIKKNLRLDRTEASVEDSKTVVKICTQYAQRGMWNIFAVIFTLTLAFAFFEPNLFASYLISIAVFGLFQAIFMANSGASWDNAKKIVEVDLREKGTSLHAATVIGDTVGDPYKDTSAVALNPIIKFSTLFGLLAAEISIHLIKIESNLRFYLAIAFLLVGLFFVYRSFYKMRIKEEK